MAPPGRHSSAQYGTGESSDALGDLPSEGGRKRAESVGQKEKEGGGGFGGLVAGFKRMSHKGKGEKGASPQEATGRQSIGPAGSPPGPAQMPGPEELDRLMNQMLDAQVWRCPALEGC